MRRGVRVDFPGSKRAANVRRRPMEECRFAPGEGREAAANRANMGRSSPIVVTGEVTCHAGGRGFESRRSRPYLQGFRTSQRSASCSHPAYIPHQFTTRWPLGADSTPLLPRVSIPDRDVRTASTQASDRADRSGRCDREPRRAEADSPLLRSRGGRWRSRLHASSRALDSPVEPSGSAEFRTRRLAKCPRT